ncbi:GlcG/HbpS family heme-binding protein [Pectobacterium sp. B1J-3]|uniref:GlcG/HbpS family heme-binding protein n=1 Tax=Pectobacterium sp. B1J-3 TaxID=3385371 RepID=UPI003905D714
MNDRLMRPDMTLETKIEQAISELHATQSQRSLSLGSIALLAQLAHDAAQAMSLPIVFSLVDAQGHQRYFFSMDNALLISYSLAYQKAYTAVALKRPTQELATLIQPGGDLYGLQQHPNFCAIGGGLPCWHHDRLLGGIGISGGTVEEDMAIAHHVFHAFSQQRFPVMSTYPK